jgi:hypothetical protein
MRPIRPLRSLTSVVLVSVLTAGALAAPATAQDLYKGKTVDELLELVAKRIEEREGDEHTGQAYSRFYDQKRRAFGPRVAPAANNWVNEPNARRSKLGRTLMSALTRRVFGDFNSCNKTLQTAYRKSQNPLQKQLVAFELAKMSQLRGARNDALKWVAAAQREGKQARSQWLEEEANKVVKMGTRLREYKELLDARSASPRDPGAHWRVCEHLRRFTDAGPRFLQGGEPPPIPHLLVDLYINYEWMRQTFPAHPAVVNGGVDSFMLDQALAAKDLVTATEVAARLLKNDQNKRATSGKLMMDMALALMGKESRRGQALKSWRALVKRYPDNPSVQRGEAQKQVRELSKDTKLRIAAKAELKPIPWE